MQKLKTTVYMQLRILSYANYLTIFLLNHYICELFMSTKDS